MSSNITVVTALGTVLPVIFTVISPVIMTEEVRPITMRFLVALSIKLNPASASMSMSYLSVMVIFESFVGPISPGIVAIEYNRTLCHRSLA